MKYLVSIIVPIFNSDKTLEKCLNSLVNQNYDNYEIVLVDDGSTDSSSIICKKYTKKHSNISYYYKNNSGVSDTRNIGIEKAQGKYLTFVDSDDYIDEKYIQTAIKYIEQGYELIVYDHAMVKNDGSILEEFILYNDNCDITSPKCIDKFFQTYCLSTACKMFFLKELLVNNKISFDSNIGYGEDMLFSITSYLYSKKTFYVHYLSYYYLMNNTSATHNDSYEKRKKYCDDNYVLYCKIHELLNINNIAVDKNIILDAMLKNMVHGIDRIYIANLSGKYELINYIILKYSKQLNDFCFKNSQLGFKYKFKLFFLKNKKYKLLNSFYKKNR